MVLEKECQLAVAEKFLKGDACAAANAYAYKWLLYNFIAIIR